MEFNQLILETLQGVFDTYHLVIARQFTNYLEFRSPCLTVVISYNNYEKSNTLLMGASGTGHVPEIDNVVLREFFGSDLRLSETTTEMFINNLALFFENEGKPLLQGDPDKIRALEQYNTDRHTAYAKRFMLEQALTAIDKAWESNNYRMFKDLMDQADISELPASYALKYKMALKKL